MPLLPPLECLRFFEAAGRRESFAKAAEELHVSSSAVAHRIKVLEEHLDGALFERRHRGVRLNRSGKAYLKDVQRILAEIQVVTERRRGDSGIQRLKLVSVESVAERWLMPRLAGFNDSWPDIAIELETDHLGVDPNRHDFDVWITYDGEVKAPSAETTRRETLFEETLFPVCSPALLETHGRTCNSVELDSWPLLYHLGWPSDWSRWFEAQGDPPPDLSRASSFRLCGMLIRATLQGMGVAIGRPTVIARELREGTLVPLFDRHNEVRTSCCLITTSAARRKPEVQAFREWILKEA